jgi:hypothetical protein
MHKKRIQTQLALIYNIEKGLSKMIINDKNMTLFFTGNGSISYRDDDLEIKPTGPFVNTGIMEFYKSGSDIWDVKGKGLLIGISKNAINYSITWNSKGSGWIDKGRMHITDTKILDILYDDQKTNYTKLIFSPNEHYINQTDNTYTVNGIGDVQILKVNDTSLNNITGAMTFTADPPNAIKQDHWLAVFQN